MRIELLKRPAICQRIFVARIPRTVGKESSHIEDLNVLSTPSNGTHSYIEKKLCSLTTEENIVLTYFSGERLVFGYLKLSS